MYVKNNRAFSNGFKYVLAFLILLIILLPQSVAAADSSKGAVFVINEKQYMSDGKAFAMDAAPFIENNRTYVPVRFLALSLGVAEADIGWDSKNMEVTLKKGGTVLILKIGSLDLKVNGNVTAMDVAPFIRDSRTYLPARYVAQALDFDVSWDEAKKAVNISPVPHENYQVKIQGFRFNPAIITINPGDSITWTNFDSMAHNAVSGIFDSGTLGTGQSFTFVFNDTGTFDYVCTFHSGMKAKVIVK